MSEIVYDSKILGALAGGEVMSTSGTSAQDSAVASGTTSSITYGDLCAYANGYWAKCADTEAASAGKYGIAQSTSTETASAAGLVKVAYHPSGLLAKFAPTTPANLAQAVLGDKVNINVSGGVQTVNEDGSGVLTIAAYNATSGAETVTVVVPYAI